MRFLTRKNVFFNPVYLKIEYDDRGFSCERSIWRVLKNLSRKFEAILITRPRSSTTLSVRTTPEFLCVTSEKRDFGEADG